MPISLLVAARTPLANDTLCRSFNHRRKQFKVVACVHSRKDLLKQVVAHHPDVALISANLENKPTGGLEALNGLRVAHPSTKVIMLSDCLDSERVVEAFSHGARAVFCTSEDFPTLCKCIRSVHAGEVWVGSSQLRWVVQALQKSEMTRIVGTKGTPLLTKGEEGIVRLVVEGLADSKICEVLGLSPHAVKNHLCSIYKKLGISNCTELLLYALGSREARRGGDDPSEQSAH